MVLQYNFVFDRAGGLAQLNNPNWPQYVSTITRRRAASWRTAPTVRRWRRSTSANRSRERNPYRLVCGPAVDRQQARTLQFIPSNPAALHRGGRQAGQRSAGESVAPGLPARRAVHGQRPVPAGDQEQGRPDRDLGARERERHRLHERPAHRNGDRPASARSRSSARTAIRIRPSTIRLTDDGTRLLIPPASRFAIAVTIPAEGELVLEMPSSAQDGAARRSPPPASSTPTMERTIRRPCSAP